MIASKKSNQTSDRQKNNSEMGLANVRFMPEMMSIMKDVFISSHSWIRLRAQQAVKLKITHIVIE